MTDYRIGRRAMNGRRFLLGRLFLALVVVYLAVSVTFAVVVFTPDTALGVRIGGAGPNANVSQIRQTYFEARGYDRPLLERYTDWLVNVTLLRWGFSVSQHRPALAAVIDGTARTALYVLPGTMLAVTGGVAFGLRSAWYDGRLGERAGRVLVYSAFGLPSFFVATVLLTLVEGAPAATAVRKYVLPAVVLAVSLLAGQMKYARTHSMELVNAEFVAFLRAKGLGSLAVWRRLLKNIAVPMVALLFTELLAVLALNVFVLERVFEIDGLGTLLYEAQREHDIPLLLGVTFVIVVIAAVGSVLQDLGSAWLDPRIDLFE